MNHIRSAALALKYFEEHTRPEWAQAIAANAQAHALLAIALELRIANLIATGSHEAAGRLLDDNPS